MTHHSAQFLFLAALVCACTCFGDETSNPFSSYLLRVRRGFSQPDLGYGGGVSFSARLNPYDRVNPVQYSTAVGYGYGLNANGQKMSNAIGYSNSLGNAMGNGNGFGGAQDNFGYGGGNANTAVAGGDGQSITNNYGFSGSNGNGYGSGGATGMVGGPWGRR